MGFQPDLAACWLFRIVSGGAIEILLIRRAPGRLYAGIWQCVTGKLEADERIVDGALREVTEETGLGAADLELVMETDLVNWFHAADLDTLLCEAVFAAQVRADAVVVLSDEHDEARWLSVDEAKASVVWPAYERGIDTVVWLVANTEKAAAFKIR